MPPGSKGYDKNPQFSGIVGADFFNVNIVSDCDIIIIGNPPFGRGSKLAIDFFNRAAKQAKVIAFILPRTVRKVEVQAKLDRRFRLVYEEILPEYSFVFRSQPKNVPAVFQIWELCGELRDVSVLADSHPRFKFTTDPSKAHFAIQRIGARAGSVHHNLRGNPSSHLLVVDDVEHVMAQLNLWRQRRTPLAVPISRRNKSSVFSMSGKSGMEPFDPERDTRGSRAAFRKRPFVHQLLLSRSVSLFIVQALAAPIAAIVTCRARAD